MSYRNPDVIKNEHGRYSIVQVADDGHTNVIIEYGLDDLVKLFIRIQMALPHLTLWQKLQITWGLR